MPVSGAPSEEAFDHLAMMYAGTDGFLAGTVPFLREGAAADEPMLVVVSAAKIAALRAALGRDGDKIHFADMEEVGHNPARIIPTWREFLDGNGGGTRRVRGIGEPIYAERTPAELVESQRHESLLNVAFEGSGSWSLLCPYDTVALPSAVIEEAARSHPTVVVGGARRVSPTCRDLEEMSGPFDAPLPAPPGAVTEVTFGAEVELVGVRELVADHATRAGLDDANTNELVLAVHEAAANSLRYGGESGRLQIWLTDDEIVCDVRDTGYFEQPLVGRERPHRYAMRGRGLWMANQLCDLVQLRTYADGNVVRLHKAR